MDEAARIGMKCFSHPGAKGMPQLQMSYIISAFRQPTYDDSMARLRRHVLLYWKAGFYKSSVIEVFNRRLTPSIDVITQPRYDPRACSYLECLKFSPARLRGSFDSGRLVLPLIQRPTILFVDELMNLLGTGENFADMVGLLNQVLEKGTGTVGFVKMIGAEINDEVKKRLAERAISYNVEEGIMQYQVNGTMWAACHLIDAQTHKILTRSGCLDRINVVNWVPNEDQFIEAWEFEPPIVDAEEFERLSKWNAALWDAEWKTIKSPPEAMLRRGKKALGKLYDQFEKKHNKSKMDGLRSARDGTNLRHLYTSYAAAQTIENDGKGPYDGIRYDLGCEEKVLDFLPEYVRSRSPYVDTSQPEKPIEVEVST